MRHSAVMIAPGLLLAVLVAAEAEPTSVVMLARRTAVPPAEAQALVNHITGVLVELKVPGVLPAADLGVALQKLNLKDATSCRGRPACVAELGRQLQARWVVMISLSQLGDERSVGLELLQVEGEAVLEKDAVLLAAKARPGADLLDGFAQRVRTRLQPPPALPPPPPPPLVLEPAPQPVSSAPLVATAPATPPPRPGRLLAASAGAALVVGIVLLTVGLVVRGQLAGRLVDGQLVSSLTIGDAQQRLTASVVELTAAGACGALAIALGAGALFTW